MCQYFSRIEDRCTQAKNQVPKQGFEENMLCDTMSTITKAYLSNHVCYIWEAVHYFFARIECMKNLSSYVFCKCKFSRGKSSTVAL